jgi:hypothetical protein
MNKRGRDNCRGSAKYMKDVNTALKDKPQNTVKNCWEKNNAVLEKNQIL